MSELPPSAGSSAPRHWLWPTTRRVVLGVLAALVIWGWLDVRARGRISPGLEQSHRSDFTVYTNAGAAFFDGRAPYQVVNVRGWGYLYPPLFAMLTAPLAGLAPENQVFVWFLISLATCGGCYRETVRIARAVMPEAKRQGRFGPIPSWIGYSAVVAALFPTLNCLQRGQVGVLKLYLLLLGLRLVMQSRTRWGACLGGVALATPIVLKVTPVVPVGFLLAQRLVADWFAAAEHRRLWPSAWSTAGCAGGLALCLLVVPATLVGWQANLTHLNTWWRSVATKSDETSSSDFAGDSTSVRNQSFENGAERLGNWIHYAFFDGPYEEGPAQLRLGGPGLLMDAAPAQALLGIVKLAAAVMLVVAGFRAAKAQDCLAQVAMFGLAGVATLILAPIARGHYYLLLLPAVTFLGAWLTQQGRGRATMVYVLVPVALVLLHYALMRITGRVGLLGLGTTAWYFAACGTIARNARSHATLSTSTSTEDGANLSSPAWRHKNRRLEIQHRVVARVLAGRLAADLAHDEAD